MVSIKKYISQEIFNNEQKFSFLKLLKIYFFGVGSARAILIYRLGKFFYDSNSKKISRLMFIKLEKNYGLFISPNAVIGVGLKIPHPSCIVIGDDVKIGNNVTIFQGVTVGGARSGDAKNKLYPDVKENCILFAGAKIIGKIKVGRSCIIGANSVVIKDVPDYCTVAGAPARIVTQHKLN